MNSEILKEKPDFSKLPGGWDFDKDQKFEIKNSHFTPRNYEFSIPFKYQDLFEHQDYQDIRVIDGFLNQEELSKLNQIISLSPNLENVGIQGMMDSSIEENIGSKRTTLFSSQLRDHISEKFNYMLLNFFNMFTTSIYFNPYYSTDIHDKDYPIHKIWRYDSISPIFRFMEYKQGGQHYTHYDAGYIYKFNPDYRTLFSYVIYLTDNEEGGETRFINDNQQFQNFNDRNLNDWDRKATDDEIILSVKPKAGRILIFPHRLAHDVNQYFGEDPRRIIRGDIIFKLK